MERARVELGIDRIDLEAAFFQTQNDGGLAQPHAEEIERVNLGPDFALKCSESIDGRKRPGTLPESRHARGRPVIRAPGSTWSVSCSSIALSVKPEHSTKA